MLFISQTVKIMFQKENILQSILGEKILKRREMKIHEVSMASAALNDKYSYPRVIKYYA